MKIVILDLKSKEKRVLDNVQALESQQESQVLKVEFSDGKTVYLDECIALVGNLYTFKNREVN